MPRKKKQPPEAAKPPEKRYAIRGLTAKQLSVIERALDMYGRIGLGQAEIVVETWQEHFWLYADEIHRTPGGEDVDYDVWRRVRWAADALKDQMFHFGPGASFGVGNPNLDPRTNIAFDMNKPLQNVLIELTDPECKNRWSCWRDRPMLYSDQPLIKVEEDER